MAAAGLPAVVTAAGPAAQWLQFFALPCPPKSALRFAHPTPLSYTTALSSLHLLLIAQPYS